MENHTAKHFVLQLSSLLFLYLSLSFLVVLMFGIINVLFPDAAQGVWETEAAVGSIRVGIAVLVVFLPCVRGHHSDCKQNASSKCDGLLPLTHKWLIYLSLLIGGGVLLGDLAAVIMTFLEGEITQRFILKATTVLVVVGAAFHYYALDARGFWMKHEDKSVMFAIGAIIAVVAAVGFGFTKIEPPAVVREQKLDTAQISDLQNIQSQVINYFYLNNELPADLAAVDNGFLPTAPEGRPAYTYEKTEKGFKLCATFNQRSSTDQYYYDTMPVEKERAILGVDNWQHKEGNVCFERVITELPK